LLITKVNAFFWMMFSPLVPGGRTPLDDLNLFWICHINSTLSAAQRAFIDLFQ
jgi:hypothetical protein